MQQTLKTSRAQERASSSRFISGLPLLPGCGRSLGALMVALAGLCLLVPAQAQSTNPLPLPSLGNTGGVIKKIDINTMAAILAEMQISTEQASANDGRQYLRAQTPGGARFFLDFLVCADRLAATGCGSVLFRAGMSNLGVTYDELNSFNKGSTVTTGFNLPELNLIGFTRLAVVEGGVARSNLSLQLGLFLTDMDNYVTNKAAATSVRFDEGAEEPVRIEDGVAARIDVDASRLLQNLTSDADQLPGWALGLTDSSMIESAIYNTYSVDFLTDEMRRFLTQ
ncbi:MAG: YbjN domain-containing protein [Pseudomonadota bacterium]